MSSFVESDSKSKFWSKPEAEESMKKEGEVSSQLFIKPAHDDDESVEGLDKQVVLRRIRHQKRLNKVRDAVQALFNKTAAADQEAEEERWVDDPFAPL